MAWFRVTAPFEARILNINRLEPAVERFQEAIAPLDLQVFGLMDIPVNICARLKEIVNLSGDTFCAPADQRVDAGIGNTGAVKNEL